MSALPDKQACPLFTQSKAEKLRRLPESFMDLDLRILDEMERLQRKRYGASMPKETMEEGLRITTGMSWTDDFDRAKWFAYRFKHLAAPAVYTLTVQPEHILAYLAGRKESEYLLRLPLPGKPKRVDKPQSLKRKSKP